ncbi:hypothetical protein GLOIN_2v1487427 [Rhizophagus clarus]|uniref:Uncharacterized protein n=1 Tax=Rhizophagus clarus TaxID=94130 RepID=A0A8H3M1S6_9GLOM|nr:hypothetical protein GLOIN_2v1487427 [Rhizophagus clarus]
MIRYSLQPFTLQALEEHRKMRTAIENMRNEDVRGTTSTVEDHTAITSVTKRSFEEKERTTKRTRIRKDSNDEIENNPFLVSGETSSTVSFQDQFSPFLDEKSSNDEFEDDEIVTNPKESGVMSLSPQLQNEDSLSHTPNKRKMNDERIVQYLNAMNQSLKYNQVTVQKPSVWTESLDTYIDNVLKELKDTFKSDIMQTIEDKVSPLLRKNINGLLQYGRYISKSFKEITFGNVSFDWIESHSPASKLTKSPTNSGIVKVDIRDVRLFDDKEIFHAEVSGPPSPSSDDHAINDAKKSLHTDILNLIAILLDHLRVPVENATKIKVFSLQVIEYRMTLYLLNMLNDGTFLTSELYSTLLPFSLDAISKYKGILYLMAVLHEEITKQISIMKDFDLAVHHNGKSIVRDVLKIPKGLKELLIIKK